MKTKLKIIIPMLLSASFAANAQDLERILSEAAGNRLSQQCAIELDTAESELKNLLKDDIARGQDIYNRFNKMVEDYRNLKQEELNQVNSEILSIQYQPGSESRRQELETQAQRLSEKLKAPAEYAVQETNEFSDDINVQVWRKCANSALCSELEVIRKGNSGEAIYINTTDGLKLTDSEGVENMEIHVPLAQEHLREHAIVGGVLGEYLENFSNITLRFENDGTYFYQYGIRRLTAWGGRAAAVHNSASERDVARFLISEDCQYEYDILKEEHLIVPEYIKKEAARLRSLPGVESSNDDRFSLETEPNLEPVSPIERGSQVNKN